MSDNEAEIIEGDKATGRFLVANSGGEREPGSRSKLSEAFITGVNMLQDYSNRLLRRV